MSFSFVPGPLSGIIVVEPRVFPDERGFFLESYKAGEFSAAGIVGPFVQDNHSSSSKGTLRGLHFQRPPHAQAKLLRVTRGAVWDVAVDIRPGSASYGSWFGIELSEANRKMLYIPEGFAHGFLALEDRSELQYKCTAEYDKAAEGGLRWDDPRLNIAWPTRDVLVSAKDSGLPFLE
jgi:dTDP-4-dehydrorhamnose 3,5-epimerase